MTGVFYFINPEDNRPYFMTGITDVVFSPLAENAVVYTLSHTPQPYSFLFEGKVVPLFVSTRDDPMFRDIILFQGSALQTGFGNLAKVDGGQGGVVNGIRYKRAMTNCEDMLLGEDNIIQYLQFLNNGILFSLSSRDAETIVAEQTVKTETYSGKVNPEKGQAKRDVIDTLNPVIKVSIYLLVIFAVVILFALVRSLR